MPTAAWLFAELAAWSLRDRHASVAHRHRRHAQISGNPLVHHPRLRTAQHDLRPHSQPPRGRPARPANQLITLVIGQHELGSGTPGTATCK